MGNSVLTSHKEQHPDTLTNDNTEASLVQDPTLDASTAPYSGGRAWMPITTASETATS